MSNPFLVLMPELWATVHALLVTPWDAVPRVALQRTCKAAHALDPGLILAPHWRALWQASGIDPEKKIAMLTILHSVHTNQLFEEPWCPVPDSIRFCCGADDADWYTRFTWRTASSMQHTVLDYYPYYIDNRWAVGIKRTKQTDWDVSVMAHTLPLLLLKCPMLCFGVSDHLFELRAAANDLKSLFVSKHYR